MSGDASTVDDYIAEAPADRRKALELLRELCTGELLGFDEAIRRSIHKPFARCSVRPLSAPGRSADA